MEQISITDPIGLAMERVRQVLFSPFDLGKWFVIGFCAWLAGLGERASGGGNFHSSGSTPTEGISISNWKTRTTTFCKISIGSCRSPSSW